MRRALFFKSSEESLNIRDNKITNRPPKTGKNVIIVRLG
jgi:hypothetical protein